MNIDTSNLTKLEQDLYQMRDKIPDYADFLSPLLKDFSDIKRVSFEKEREFFKNNRWKYKFLCVLNNSTIIISLMSTLLFVISFLIVFFWIKNPFLMFPASLLLFVIIMTLIGITIESLLKKYSPPPSDYSHIEISKGSKQILNFLDKTLKEIQKYSPLSQNDIWIYLLNHHESRIQLNTIFNLINKNDLSDCQRLLEINFQNKFQTEYEDIKNFVSQKNSFDQNRIRLNQNLNSLKLLQQLSECENNEIIQNFSDCFISKSNEEIVAINRELEEVIKNTCANPNKFSIEHLHHLQSRYLK